MGRVQVNEPDSPEYQAFIEEVAAELRERLPEHSTMFQAAMYEDEFGNTRMNGQSVLRNIFYDSTLPDPESALGEMGVPPISEEGVEMVRADSLRRQMRFMHCLPLIESVATTLSLGKAWAIDQRTGHTLPEVHVQSIADGYRQAFVGGAMGAVSLLVDTGYLVVPGTHMPPAPEQDEDEVE